MKAENLAYAMALVKELLDLHRAKYQAIFAQKETASRVVVPKFEIKPAFGTEFSMVLKLDFFNEVIEKRCGEIYAILDEIGLTNYENYDRYKERVDSYQ